MAHKDPIEITNTPVNLATGLVVGSEYLGYNEGSKIVAIHDGATTPDLSAATRPGRFRYGPGEYFTIIPKSGEGNWAYTEETGSISSIAIGEVE